MDGSPATQRAPWPRGSTVLYRYGRRGRARSVRLGTVIDHGPDGLALWVASGSPQVEGVLADGQGIRTAPLADRPTAPRSRRLTTWRGPGIVMLVPPAGEWSAWWFFEPDGSFAGWYGNLEAPHVWWQDAAGQRVIDTADRALDVWAAPDRTCVWKDEDEFAVFTGAPGYWTAAEAAGIRAAGVELMRLIGAGAAPFDGRWTDFRPDPSWPVPALPEGWDQPHRAGP
jgi:hypothetical protein